MTETIEHEEALALLTEGFSIFPMHRARILPDGVTLCTCGAEGRRESDGKIKGCDGKHPRVPFSEWATSDKKIINDWWTRHPESNIGVHLGKSHCWVLDIDGDAGRQELKDLTGQYGDLTDTRQVLTGSGNGDHYYFSAWVDKINSGYITKNIHIKGNVGNAYVVAPPSRHIAGNRYQYINRVLPIDAPDWLLTLIKEKSNTAEYNGRPLTREEIESRQGREVHIEKLLTPEQMALLHREGNLLIGYHPVHKTSDSPREFSINLMTNRWRCWWHQSSGGLFDLAAMLTGQCKCEEFTRKPDEIWINPISGKTAFAKSITAAHDLGIPEKDLRIHMRLAYPDGARL